MLTPSQVAAAAAVRFSSGNDVIAYFDTRFGAHFNDWFNAHCAGRGAWKGKALDSSPDVKSRFLAIWDNIPLIFDSASINLLQFAALASILIVEAGAELLPSAELCGCQGYPGLVYAFEQVPGVKASYNSGSGNKPAGDLFFDDTDFWEAHSHLPAADLVRAIPNLRDEWNAPVYPCLLAPSTLDPAESGFIQQADFFKFRGRGFIQTTWRANYKPIVEFVQNYAGGNTLLARYRDAWAGTDPDTICTTSTNDDWDTLFKEPDLIVSCRAIALHNQASGKYLSLSRDAAVLMAGSAVPGSFYRMGLRINGGAEYATLFTERTVELLSAMNPPR
jgi:hypothetical protein